MLTDPDFWDDYWQNLSEWDNVDVRRSYDRCFDQTFRRYLSADSKLRLMEIGCAPGRWLIYFQQQFGYQVSGCDSAPQAVKATRANLSQAGVSGEVLQADLMDESIPSEAYDIVVSLGVIEHFIEPWAAVAQHVRLIKPGGLLVLEIPNYAGLNQWLLKRGAHQLLAVHNTSIMRLEFLQAVAERFNLEPRFMGYIGGFEPGLWDGTGQRWLLRNFVRVGSLARRTFRFFDRVNHPRFSGYLMGIYRK